MHAHMFSYTILIVIGNQFSNNEDAMRPFSPARRRLHDSAKRYRRAKLLCVSNNSSMHRVALKFLSFIPNALSAQLGDTFTHGKAYAPWLLLTNYYNL